MKISPFTYRKYRLPFAFLILLFFIIGCEKDYSIVSGKKEEPPSPPIYEETLTGRILLEDQYEHSNALIYIDGLNIGARSDSSGFFMFRFPDSIQDQSGIFTVYYFVEDFDLDSAIIELQEGRLQKGKWDVDSSGALPLKELNHLLEVEGWTDRQQYRIGDTLFFHMIIRNISNRQLHIEFVNVSGDFGRVSLYRDKTYPPVIISHYDNTNTDMDVYMNPGGYYEGFGTYIIPQGVWVDDSLYVLHPGKYRVVAGFTFKDRGYPIPQQIRDYILQEWYYDPEALTGLYMEFTPHKYKYPEITILP